MLCPFFFLLVLGIFLKRRRNFHVHLAGKISILAIFGQRGLANDRAAFHSTVILRSSEMMARTCQCQFGTNRNVTCLRAAEFVSIVTGPSAYAASLRAAIPKRQGDDVV